MTPTFKRRGESAELAFMARANAKGLTVCKPWGDSVRYDFIVEHRGRCFRVQVKSTAQQRGSAYFCSTVSCSRTGLRLYRPDEVDFFACYIVPDDVWYIIPLAEMRGARAAVLLAPSAPRNRYFPFLEAWHLLFGEEPPPRHV